MATCSQHAPVAGQCAGLACERHTDLPLWPRTKWSILGSVRERFASPGHTRQW